MRQNLFIFIIGLLILNSCGEKQVAIINSEYENFSNLNIIEYPDMELFYNYETLPISITNGDFCEHNSILFLTESTNLIPIERENLKKILQQNEFEEYIKNRCEKRTDSLICSKEYYAYGRIIKPKYILLEIGIRDYAKHGRHYIFEFRTYKPNGKLISKIDFAKWSDNDNEYFEGKLTEKMKVEIKSKKKIIAEYSIEENGIIKKKDDNQVDG
jgi:hypothetical protein